MIGIQNVGKVNTKDSRYEVFIYDGKRKHIAYFVHRREDGLAHCLLQAHEAVKDKTRPTTMREINEIAEPTPDYFSQGYYERGRRIPPCETPKGYRMVAFREPEEGEHISCYFRNDDYGFDEYARCSNLARLYSHPIHGRRRHIFVKDKDPYFREDDPGPDEPSPEITEALMTPNHPPFEERLKEAAANYTDGAKAAEDVEIYKIARTIKAVVDRAGES